ncbi:hypothetical protein Bca4012_022861 [Brassica carinata]
MIQQNKQKNPQTQTAQSPKEKPRPNNCTASPHSTFHVLNPQPPKRRVSGADASSSQSARARRWGYNRTITGVSSLPTPFQTEVDAEPNDNITTRSPGQDQRTPKPPPTTILEV